MPLASVTAAAAAVQTLAGRYNGTDPFPEINMTLFPTQGTGNGQPGDPLKFIRSYLGLAIQIGAPAYNLGDQRGCYEVYACTARMLLAGVKGADDARQTLRQALEHCSTRVDVNELAWVMRRAFDAILGAETESEPS